MTKFNYLTDYAALYREDINEEVYSIDGYPIEWTFLNVSSTPSIDEVTFRHSSRLSIEIRNPNSSPYSFEGYNFPIPSDRISSEFSFNAMFKCAAPASVQIYLYDNLELFSSVEPVVTELSTSEWAACFSNIFQFTNENLPTYGLSVRIVISNHDGKIVHFTMPNLVEDKPFLTSTYYNPARRFFPDVYYDVDSQQTSPTFPFLKLWHSLTGVSDTVMKQYLDIFQHEDAEKPVSIKSQMDSSNYLSFSSQLTNPEIMPNHYTQWASMFIGNLIKSGIYIAEDVTINSPIKYIIGDTGPGGGQVFITPDTVGNSTGKYFEALNTGAFVSWTDTPNQNTLLSTASEIGSGYDNTAQIIALGSSAETTIESLFATLTYGGYSDWFVPSIDELLALYEVKNDLSISFYEDNYWSSTEDSSNVVFVKDFGITGMTQTYAKGNTVVAIPVRMFDAPTVPVTIPGTVQQEGLPDSLEFRRKQLSTRMYGFSAGTKGALKNAARSVVGEDAAVIITPNWNNDEWAIMVRTLTASTPGVSGSGQSSSAVYYTMEPAKPAGYTLMHQSIDEITFVLDDNDFGVFNQSVLG